MTKQPPGGRFGDWVLAHSDHPELRGSAFDVLDAVDHFCSIDGLGADEVRELVLRAAREDGELPDDADDEAVCEALSSFEHLLYAFEDPEDFLGIISRERALDGVYPGPGVYFMRDGELLKVGKAEQSVKTRFRSHRSSNLRAFVMAVVRDDSTTIAATEGRLHAELRDHVIPGESEWFRFVVEVVTALLDTERRLGRMVWTPS